jgi:dimethylargininase
VFAQFTRAILRLPGKRFADGLTSASEGAPQLPVALSQHVAYARALEDLGLTIEVLPADENYPDGTFVEDAAIVTPHGAIITRPGAASRAGETGAIETALTPYYASLAHITAPGTVDGGDICETDSVVLIGISARTNEAGAHQLSRLLADIGFKSRIIDVRTCAALLHFKTGISSLGDGRLAVAPGLPHLDGLEGFEQIELDPSEAYAANCIRVNDRIVIPSGCPRFEDQLSRLGYTPLALDMSEFKKMDGGLSCLSLRF